MQETRFDPWVGKMPWRRERPPTPVFLPGESHGQRSLAGGYSPRGRRESDTPERLDRRRQEVPEPYSGPVLVICFRYRTAYMSIPISSFTPPPRPPLATANLCVCESVSDRSSFGSYFSFHIQAISRDVCLTHFP